MTDLLMGILMMAGASMGHQATHAQTHQHKQTELDRRGALAMGFDQQKTAHEFLTSASGGSIEVRVRAEGDTESMRQIRIHLAEIAKAFAAGDFTKPFQTHAEVPPGVPAMQRLRGVIRYEYADTPRGGIVRIRTEDRDALAAVHEFLSYQRREHNHEKGQTRI